VEAYTSLPALAQLLGVGEGELLQLGDDWVNAMRYPRACVRNCGGACSGWDWRSQFAERKASPGIVISGWPSLLADEDRKALIDGIDASCSAASNPPALACVVPPSSGNDPNSALPLPPVAWPAAVACRPRRWRRLTI